MYQESDDKIRGTSRKDIVLFILLILAFFAIGTAATVLKNHFDNALPMYVFALLGGLCVYIIYRVRILGYRYTVFYKEPEPEYDARFDDYITHEDYPYPVGTVVIERTVSAKGDILAVIKREELIALLDAGEDCEPCEEVVYGPRKKEKCSSLIVERDGVRSRIYFTPSDEFKGYVRSILESK